MKKIAAVLQAEAVGSKHGWHRGREKCHVESSAPVASFGYSYRYRAANTIKILQKPLRLKVLEERRGNGYI